MRSQDWLARQKKDVYSRKAQEQGYASRASFKLLQMQQRDHFIKPGMCVIDLGAAPGGWSQVLVDIIGNRGKVVALDKLPMRGIAGVDFIQGDFTETYILKVLENHLATQKINRFDLVLSDIAPNISGISLVDQCESIYLAELALDFCLDYLKKDGNFLVKVFEGSELFAYKQNLQKHFTEIRIRKPEASRSGSKELYLLACSKRN